MQEVINYFSPSPHLPISPSPHLPISSSPRPRVTPSPRHPMPEDGELAV
ncbi:hypothetical protein [Anabaena lutea]|uniref:Uncharacterized protein n=1 Tax=Anabaena lutea FACHB-196 TaxID=2692881 RepID=A0ABR8FGM5_9NOST|nr:hypothetical protein [Anabaena lutea]MBD2568074.1 hypothetical protein [Anabaena lutea FACHB-196]